MRILHVIATNQRRGAEMFASQLISALGDAGVDQRVIVLRGAPDSPLAFKAETEVWASEGWRMPGLKLELASLKALRSAIRGWSPNLVQAHGGEAFKHVLFAALGTNTRIVYRKIGEIAPWASQGARKSVHGRLMKRATRIVTVAEAMREEAIDLFGCPPNRVMTIPRGVNPQELRPLKGRDQVRDELGIPRTSKVILSLGALSWEKDPLAHLRIGRAAASLDSSVVHVIAGDGPLRREVDSAIVDRKAAPTTLVLGVRADVGDLLAATDVMLLASRTEGMPGCLIEAGMAGVAAAAYDVGGVSEVVEDGETGLLARPGDESDLGELVAKLLRDDSMRERLGTAARQRCLELFDSRVVAGRYMQLYQELLSA